MQTIPKCFLLPIDGTNESLRPADFIGALYPPSEVRLVLSYFFTPPPPAYTGAIARSKELQGQKRQFLENLKRDERNVFDHAREELEKMGFSKEFIQEHVEPKGMGVAKQACLLGDFTKVDAIAVRKHVKTHLEDLVNSDPSSALARHCIECPVWMTEGVTGPRKAAILISDQEDSMRIADHAGYMLSDTSADIDLIGRAGKIPHPLTCRPPEAEAEFSGHATVGQVQSLLSASARLADYGIAQSRVRMTLIPGRGDAATEILSFCATNGIGILGLGRTREEGIFGFLRTSATRKITSDFRDMAVWIA